MNNEINPIEEDFNAALSSYKAGKDLMPIVGKGIYYEKEKIKIIGKTKEFSTGGIGYNSLKGRLTEILGGEIFYLLKKLYSKFQIILLPGLVYHGFNCF